MSFQFLLNAVTLLFNESPWHCCPPSGCQKLLTLVKAGRTSRKCCSNPGSNPAKCIDAFHWDKHTCIPEFLFWWSFICGWIEGAFREDGNEMMESQQSTCYTDLSLKKKTHPNLKGKRSSPSWTLEGGKRLHGILRKGTFMVWFLPHSAKQDVVYILCRYPGLHSTISASVWWKQTSTEKLL